MKRYLTGYSKGVLTIRDRLTGQVKRISNIDADEANEIQEKIIWTNYNIPDKKSKVKISSIDEHPNWMKTVQKDTRIEYGWIQPNQIKWYKEPKQEQKEKTLSQKLDDLLNQV